MNVEIWQEEVVIPTYEAGKPEKNPIFLEKRVYQGSSGVVYPYPVIEQIADEKTDKTYRAVFLENEYLKIMILPELGGRVQMAWDKIKQRHFIYYNRVIKPALVGLTGPWISGGIEFNWPQHHRPSTFLPVDFSLEQLEDGSATVWVNEMEKMFHQRARVGFTLRPGQAVLEINAHLSNRTPIPQTFLWWANPAVAVNDFYQSVFPPDVRAVFDHGKRDVSTFPIATGTYYKVDYSAGVDISNYKNIPVPTSYMAMNSEYNFVGGYENDTQAGVLHVADHHVSPGKKQWTWGNGDFGKAWDRNLTDEDGPYIELMAGVYTDNQPDFSWLQPYEEKSFTQYFLPYRELGVVKNASSELLLNLEQLGNKAVVKVFATRHFPQACITLGGFLNETADLSPESVFVREVEIGTTSLAELELCVHDASGKLLLSWKPEAASEQPMPEAAKPALLPSEIDSCEQLYLTGLHLEQYRHATFVATDYYQEALRRDPGDVRNNNAMGLWLLRRGQFSSAEPYFRAAIRTLTQRNPNPYDGEPLYNLGLSLRYQGRYQEAYDAFYKACWNAAMQDVAYFELARISCRFGRWKDALSEVEKALVRNGNNHQARALKVAILRHSGQLNQAFRFLVESLEVDSFNYGCLYEEYLLKGKTSSLTQLHDLMRGEIHNYEEIALDYAAAGLYEEAIDLLRSGAGVSPTSPMTYYYLAWFQQTAHSEALIKAAAHQPDFCFPNRPEAILALEFAQKANPQDAKAPYYLGNLWYDKRQYMEAKTCWEKSVSLDSSFPTAFRNLALAYFNKFKEETKAVECLEKAFALDPTDARVFMELDQLYKRLCKPHLERLERLEQHLDLVKSRDDLYLEWATLCNQTRQFDKAKELIDGRIFHPWEGGEGKVSAQYQRCRVELAKIALQEKKNQLAIDLLMECLEYPHHLGEGKLSGAQENEFHYWLGCAYEKLGKQPESAAFWKLATMGMAEPAAAVFYNDQKPETLFYQGLAFLKLGQEEPANLRFDRLREYGETHAQDEVRMDYFAVSLPDLLIWEDDLTHRNTIHCLYLQALGCLGQGLHQQAEGFFQQASQLDPNHQGVQIHRDLVKF